MSADVPTIQPAEPTRRRWPVPGGLAGTAVTAGLVAAGWGFFARLPVMYVAGLLVAGVGAGLLVGARLTRPRQVLRAVLGAGTAVVVVVAGLSVPGWRPVSAAEPATVWRAAISRADTESTGIVVLPAGRQVWVLAGSTLRVVDRDSGVERAHVSTPHWRTAMLTDWGVVVAYGSSHETQTVAGYRPDGTRRWRFTDRRHNDLDVLATSGQVAAVVACRPWSPRRGDPKTCPATGVDGSGRQVWHRQVSTDRGDVGRDAHVFVSRSGGRWHVVDARTGHDLAVVPKDLKNPWVSGDHTVFTRSRSAAACDVVGYRAGTRSLQGQMRGPACRNADLHVYDGGWAAYQGYTGGTYLVDAPAGRVRRMPDLDGKWLGYRAGVAVSITGEDGHQGERELVLHGTSTVTGKTRWSRPIGDGSTTATDDGLVLLSQPDRQQVDGADYAPDACLGTLYSSTGHRLTRTRLPDGVPHGAETIGTNAVLLYYDDHVTYLAPA